MPPIAVLPVRGTEIGALALDCAVTQLHSESAELPEHPLETGSTVNDAVQRRRPHLRLEGLFTSAPIDNSSAGADDTNHIDRYTQLLEMFQAEEPVTVVTTLRVYENMLIESLSVPRDAEKSGSVFVTCELRQVLFVNSETIAIAASAAPTGATTATGRQSTTTASATNAEGARSTLSRFLSDDPGAALRSALVP